MGTPALTPEELAFFETQGYLGPFQLLDPASVDAYSAAILEKKKQHSCLQGFQKSKKRKALDHAHVLAQRALYSLGGKDGPLGAPTLWYKNTHLLVPEVAAPGLDPNVTGRIQGVLGEDILLWGAEIITKQNKSHRWHTDIEHSAWEGVTVWLGLSNVGPDNTMKVIPGSHAFGISPLELTAKHGAPMNNDEELLALARCIKPDASIVTMNLKPGDFFIFAGSTWHASHDISEKLRTAIIYQYCRPSARVRIPQSYDPPHARFYPAQPPVMLAGGKDRFGINHLIDKKH